MDVVGVPNRVHYWMLATFAVGVASGPIGFALEPGGREMRNPVTIGLCAGGMIFAPFILIVGRRTNYVFKDWIFQSALFFALLGTFTSNLVTPHMIAPFMTLYILAPIGAAFYLPARKAIPFAVLSAAAIAYMTSRVHEPNATLRGAILTIVALAVAQIAARLRAALARAVELNREIAERDPLTNAHNLRRLNARLADEIARAERGAGNGFALAMFDLDNFKQVNDNLSHTVGDDVLIATAEAISSALLPTDLLVRRGGDEFAVVMPNVAGRDPEVTVQLARRRIEDARRSIHPGLTPFSSAGWVSHTQPEDAGELIARADAALHDAKRHAPERRGHRSSQRVDRPVDDCLVKRSFDRPRGDADTLQDDPVHALITILGRSAMFVIAAVIAAIVGLWATGHTTFQFTVARMSLIAVWLFAFPPVVIWAVTRERRPAWFKYLLGVAVLALLSAAAVAAGAAATALIDLFMLAALYFVALLPARYGLAFVVASMSAYAAFLYANAYPYAEIRLSVATMNVSLAAMVLSITRHHTIMAARQKARLARTDALTGMANLRRLRDRLDDEIRRCTITREGFAMLMLDLNRFKQVNDIYGHSVGDRVLVEVADALQAVCRHADMPARRGGDEFAVVMTDAGGHAAKAAAKRVADAIRDARLARVTDVDPDASVGWVVWRRGETTDDLIDRADGALHAVKAEARGVRAVRALAS